MREDAMSKSLELELSRQDSRDSQNSRGFIESKDATGDIDEKVSKKYNTKNTKNKSEKDKVDRKDKNLKGKNTNKILNIEKIREKLSAFCDLGLKDEVILAIDEAGFSTPSPIQERTIPLILERKDVIAQAQTGTGKTAAFALPILHTLKNNHNIQALVITPTRELAMQISEEIFKLGKFLRTKTICIYGGQSIKKQIELMSEKKPQVIVATPGRLLDHLKNERIKNFTPSVVVLDESDEMLDMGFIEDIEEIFNFIPSNAQTLLFSATLPERIKELANKILSQPAHVKVTANKVANTDISQRYYIINENERQDAIIRLVDTESPYKSIIFTRTKREAHDLNIFLQDRGYKSVELHGDMDQYMRRESIKAFRNNKSDILVATDVAARGLDISDISHVFNYHIPINTEAYVHRIGRTGRAGKKGIAITLATPLEYKDLKKIQHESSSELDLYEIPCIVDDSVINKIIHTKVSDEAITAYESIKDRIDNAQLILRLLSAYFKKNLKIGLSKEEVKNARLEGKDSDYPGRVGGVGRSDSGGMRGLGRRDSLARRAGRDSNLSGGVRGLRRDSKYNSKKDSKDTAICNKAKTLEDKKLDARSKYHRD